MDELVKAGKAQEARRLMEQARSRELQEMIVLFQRLKELARETAKELAMVVAAVESIASDRIQEVQAGALAAGCGLARSVARRTSANSLAIILESDMFDAGTPR